MSSGEHSDSTVVRKNMNMRNIHQLVLSSLEHTWLIDIDGTIAIHNGYLMERKDIPIENSLTFLRNLPKEDYIVFLTSREEKYRMLTEKFLADNDIRYNAILFGLPVGERILINDDKPSGLCMSYAICLERNKGISFGVTIDETI